MTTHPQRWTQASVRTDMWVDPDDDPRESATSPVGERETLMDYLRVYRHTLRMKCDGLGPEQLALRSVPPSSMSLLGIVRHLAEVELTWTVRVMRGERLDKPYSTAADRDGDFNGAVGEAAVVEHAWATWAQACAATDTLVDETADLGATSLDPGSAPIALREVLVHLVEEYARHCGHADLLRECIDGRVGQ